VFFGRILSNAWALERNGLFAIAPLLEDAATIPYALQRKCKQTNVFFIASTMEVFWSGLAGIK